MKITPEELSHMQAVAAAATAGSWQYNPFDATIFSVGQPFATGVPPGEQPRPEDYDVSVRPVFHIHEEQQELENLENDAEFCCAARAFVPKAIEALRFTEASTADALLILDDAMAGEPTTETLLLAIDYAVQKLRPVPAPAHDAEALAQLQDDTTDCPYCGGSGEADPNTSDVNCDICGGSGRVPALPDPNTEALAQLAEKYPIELPWLNCAKGCPAAQGVPVCGGKCEKGGEGK